MSDGSNMFSSIRSDGPSLRSPRALALFFAAYAAGIAVWGSFFEWGDAHFTAFDWPKERAYFDLLQRAVVDVRVPLHTEPSFQGTARFMANPELPISPQMILLRWLTVPQFIVANWLLLYSCGAAGIYVLARRIDLRLLPALYAFALFAFNGHIVAHVAVGHSMWAGYFLFPLFAWALFRLLYVPRASLPSRSTALAVVLTACMAQGAFHMTAWLLGFTALAGLVHRGARIATFASIGVFLLLSAHRIVPAAAAFAQLRRPANLGYPSFEVLAHSMVSIRDWNTPPIENIGWWEYDMFLGYAGTATILLFGAYAIATRPRYRNLLIPIGVVLVLSMGDTFRPIADLPLPFVNSERGPTRFIIVPVFFLLILAAVGAGGVMARSRARCMASVVGVTVSCAMVWELHQHLSVWRLAEIEVGFSQRAVERAVIVVRDDPSYVHALQLGWSVSALTAIGLVGYALHRRARAS